MLPSKDLADPGYRRLRYLRYADDWLVGFAGPRREAEAIQAEIGRFLRADLELEPAEPKTLITHGRTQAGWFRGYQIVVLGSDVKRDQHGRRSINGQIGLKVPVDVIHAKCKPYLHHGTPIHRAERMVDTDFSIIAQYQATYRGVVNSSQLAFNRYRFGRLRQVMECALTKTLAAKYRSSVGQVYRRYRAVLAPAQGPRAGLRVVIERGEGRAPLVAQ